MWEAWKISKSFSALPSVVYKIHDDADAFAFDRAVHLFGSTLQGKLDAVEGKNSKEVQKKREGVLNKYLGSATPDSKKFADPGQRST